VNTEDLRKPSEAVLDAFSTVFLLSDKEMEITVIYGEPISESIEFDLGEDFWKLNE
jgi:hypothetical protein